MGVRALMRTLRHPCVVIFRRPFAWFEKGARRSAIVIFLGAFASATFSSQGAPRSPAPRFPELASIHVPPVFRYAPSPRDPFIDAAVTRTLLSEANAPDPADRESGLDAYAMEFSQLLRDLYRVQGIICGTKGGSALIGRRILKVGDNLDLFLSEELQKRLEQTNRSLGLGLDETLQKAVLSAEVVQVDPSGVTLSMPDMKPQLVLPYQKTPVGSLPQESTPKLLRP